MSRITKEIQQSVSVRLLTMIENDLKVAFNTFAKCVSKLSEQKEDSREYSDLIFKLNRYIISSQTVFDNLIEWSESQLLDKPHCSSGLNFQTEVVIQFIKSIGNEKLSFKNHVADIINTPFNSSLFDFILRNLLLFSLRYFKAVEELRITSLVSESDIIISVSIIKRTVFEKSDANDLGKIYEASNISQRDNITLMLCYDMLSLYGGNLWSECSEGLVSKLFFCLPNEKLRN